MYVSHDNRKPTTQEWQELYTAATEFHEMAPWEWMWDSDTAGVQDPASGEVGYCSIMGRLGEHFALTVYLGEEGLAGLWQMRLSPPNDPMETLFLQKCLMASFEDRAMLKKRDLEQIKEFGLKFRGRNTWPMFRSYQPGYAPWFLTGQEARFLTVALQQAMHVAKRFQQQPNMLPEPNPEGPYLIRSQVKRKGEVEWQEKRSKRRPLFMPRPPLGPLTVDINSKRIQKLKASLPVTTDVLEMDFFLSPNGIQEDGGERPYFPFILMTADPSSGLILGIEISRPGEVAGDLIEQFLGIVEGLQMLPGAIAVSHMEAEIILSPVAAGLGIEVTLVRNLHAVSAARRDLTDFTKRRMF